MATYSDVEALSAALFPDIGSREISPADIRQIVTALNSKSSGSSFLYVNVDVTNAGDTYTIAGAAVSIEVFKGGILLAPGVDYTFAAGTWTFAEDNNIGVTLLFVYS